jgi:1-aminocyclopropane-1-carboxylate deaminase
MKQGEYLNDTLKPLIPHTRWSLATEFHGGGFGKMNTELHDFMQQFRDLNHIELDRVYTAKMMLGLQYRLQQQRISSGLRILAIHTGGLQGNRP